MGDHADDAINEMIDTEFDEEHEESYREGLDANQEKPFDGTELERRGTVSLDDLNYWELMFYRGRF